MTRVERARAWGERRRQSLGERKVRARCRMERGSPSTARSGEGSPSDRWRSVLTSRLGWKSTSVLVGCLLNALPGSPADPVTDQFVLGHGRGSGLDNLYQPASFQYPDGILHSGFRQAGPCGQFLQAQRNTSLLLAIERRPEDDVDQESGGGTIVAGQIRKKHVHDVFVNRNMLHQTIV